MKRHSLAKKGFDNLDSDQVLLPIPKVLWKGALRSISPKWSFQRGGYFDFFYLSVTDILIVGKFSLPRIVGFIQSTKRFTKCGINKV